MKLLPVAALCLWAGFSPAFAQVPIPPADTGGLGPLQAMHKDLFFGESLDVTQGHAPPNTYAAAPIPLYGPGPGWTPPPPGSIPTEDWRPAVPTIPESVAIPNGMGE